MPHDSEQLPVMNPFLVPGSESPLRPLRPWQQEAHAELYVDVNGTAAAFERYRQQTFSDESLLESGRLVLVTGESGCGKTTLINRCAHWTSTRLAELGLNGVVFDLTMTGSLHSVEDRVRLTAERLLEELADRAVMSAEVLANLDASDPRRLYAELGTALPADVVLIVLLSPVELMREVTTYAQLVRRRLVFFAESSFFSVNEVSRVQAASPEQLITLSVEPLTADDVRRFITDRLRRYDGRWRYPRISAKTMEQVAVPLRSIAQLQQILAATYEERERQGAGYTDDDWVTYEDITRTFYEKSFDELRIQR